MNSLYHNAVKRNHFSRKEWALLKKYAPCLMLDEKEPFKPVKVGVAIYYRNHHLLSMEKVYRRKSKIVKVDPDRKMLYTRMNYLSQRIFQFWVHIWNSCMYSRPFKLRCLYEDRLQPIKMTIWDRHWKFQRAKRVLEYAFYYDSDIGHIYELEHVWVYLDQHDVPIGVKGSRHGMVTLQYPTGQSIEFYERTHPILYASPGKHAIYSSFSQMKPRILVNECTQKYARSIMVDIPFFSPKNWRSVLKNYPGRAFIERIYREKFTFLPSFRFNSHFVPDEQFLMPWELLERDIPLLLVDFFNTLVQDASFDEKNEK